MVIQILKNTLACDETGNLAIWQLFVWLHKQVKELYVFANFVNISGYQSKTVTWSDDLNGSCIIHDYLFVDCILSTGQHAADIVGPHLYKLDSCIHRYRITMIWLPYMGAISLWFYIM